VVGYRRFKDPCCFHLPRRPRFDTWPPWKPQTLL